MVFLDLSPKTVSHSNQIFIVYIKYMFLGCVQIYIYICDVNVCVCVCKKKKSDKYVQ